MKQAPKGGMTVNGVFYKGGQFLPVNEPQRGKFNRKAAQKPVGRKVEIAPFKWEYAPEGKRSIYSMVAGVVASVYRESGIMFFCGNERSLKYAGYTEEYANELINRWNNGERWV